MSTPFEIVICDDQKLWIEPYKEALASHGFDVKYFQTTKSLLDELQSDSLNQARLFILDVEFERPFFHYALKDCNNGRTAGLRLAHSVRDRLPSVAIILFTGASLQATLELSEVAAEALRTEKWRNSAFLMKKDYKAVPFVKFVIQYIKRGRFPGNALTRWLSKFGIEIPLGGGPPNITIN